MTRKRHCPARQGQLREKILFLQRAKRDYHDCIARYGYYSAEAQVAQRLWHKLRSKRRLGSLAVA